MSSNDRHNNEEMPMKSTEKKEYIRTSEAGRLIGCDRNTVRNLLRENKLRGFQDEEQVWYVDKASVLKYIGITPHVVAPFVPGQTVDNPECELARHIIEDTNDSLLLLGKAGTGKTTFLNNITSTTKKLTVVLAFTGIAALKAKGETIHSFFKFYPDDEYTPNKKVSIARLPEEKRLLINRLRVIIIDEISMVRADLMDRIDGTLKAVRQNDKPFGGVQMVLIGDLRQLPPVVDEDNDEQEMIDHYYKSPYFFDSNAFSRLKYQYVELKHVYRNEGVNFVDMLNRVRDNAVTSEDIRTINSRYKKNATNCIDDYTTCLVTHRYKANIINKRYLAKLPGERISFKAISDHYIRDKNLYSLNLKVGAHVMFLQNNPPYYYNGTMGVVTLIAGDSIKVRVRDTCTIIEVNRSVFSENVYKFDKSTNQLRLESHELFKQYPLALAWAITVHKSQGQTFDKVILDIRDCFAEGQAYVALSRCRSLEGITMSTKITGKQIITNSRVDDFLDEQRKKNKTVATLIEHKQSTKQERTQVQKKMSVNKSTLQTIKAFKSGLSVEEIAAARQVSIGTIVGHLAKGIEVGVIDIGDLVDVKTLKKVSGELAKHLVSEYPKKEVFNALNGTVDYNIITYVLTWMKNNTEK